MEDIAMLVFYLPMIIFEAARSFGDEVHDV